jgi:hypothetical protein
MFSRQRHDDVVGAHVEAEIGGREAGEERAARHADAAAAERARQRVDLRAVGREAHAPVDVLHGHAFVRQERGEGRARQRCRARQARVFKRPGDAHLQVRRAREKMSGETPFKRSG